MGIGPEELAQLDMAKCGILIGTAMGGMSTFSSAVEDLTLKVGHLPYLTLTVCQLPAPAWEAWPPSPLHSRISLDKLRFSMLFSPYHKRLLSSLTQEDSIL